MSIIYRPHNRQSGFSLIELLLVASIIGLLTSVILASTAEARLRSRDAKRLIELQQFRTALELCYSKQSDYFINNDMVANTPTSVPLADADFITDWNTRCGEFGKVPIDPSGLVQVVHANSNFSRYVIMAQMESSRNQMTTTKINEVLNNTGLSSWTPHSSLNYIIGG